MKSNEKGLGSVNFQRPSDEIVADEQKSTTNSSCDEGNPHSTKSSRQSAQQNALPINRQGDSYYFTHPSNLRNDSRIIPIRRKFGFSGYGLVIAIMEQLRDQPYYSWQMDGIDDLAHVLSARSKKLQQTINAGLESGLFAYTNDGSFHCPLLSANMVKMDERRRQQSLGGQRSWATRQQRQSTVQSMLEPSLNDLQTIRKDKIKEEQRREHSSNFTAPQDGIMKEFQPGIRMAEGDYHRLCSDYGETCADHYVKIVSLHLRDTNKSTRDAAALVEKWIVKDKQARSGFFSKNSVEHSDTLRKTRPECVIIKAPKVT